MFKVIPYEKIFVLLIIAISFDTYPIWAGETMGEGFQKEPHAIIQRVISEKDIEIEFEELNTDQQARIADEIANQKVIIINRQHEIEVQKKLKISEQFKRDEYEIKLSEFRIEKKYINRILGKICEIFEQNKGGSVRILIGGGLLNSLLKISQDKTLTLDEKIESYKKLYSITKKELQNIKEMKYYEASEDRTKKALRKLENKNVETLVLALLENHFVEKKHQLTYLSAGASAGVLCGGSLNMGFGISRDSLGGRKLIAVPGWRYNLAIGVDVSLELTKGTVTKGDWLLKQTFFEDDFGYGANMGLFGWISNQGEMNTKDETKKTGFSIGASFCVRHIYKDIPRRISPTLKRDYEWLRNQLGILPPQIE